MQKIRVFVMAVAFIAGFLPPHAFAQHCLEQMSAPAKSHADKLVDKGNGVYYLTGPVTELEWNTTFHDFKRQHTRLIITDMQVGEHRSDRCQDRLSDIALITEPLKAKRAATPLATVMIGTMDSYKAYVKAMRKAGISMGSAYYSPDRTVEAVPMSGDLRHVTFAIVTPKDLGFTSGVHRSDFYAQAQANGLYLAPAEAALALRLAYRQPHKQTIWVASEGVRPKAYAWHKDGSATPRIFGLGSAGDASLFLVSESAYDDGLHDYVQPDEEYAFALSID